MIITEIRKQNEDVGITILSNRPGDARSLYGVNAINRWNIFKIRNAMKKSKLFISGGGSVIQDATSTKSLLYYLGLIVLAKHYKNKVMLYANGIGPLKSNQNRKMTKKVLNKVDVITLREDDSKELLNELGVINPKIHVTCDPVIGLEDIPLEDVENLLFRHNLYGKDFVVVSVRLWKDAPLFEAEFISAIKRLKQETGYQFVFIPLHHPNDVEFSKKLANITDSVCIEKRLSAEMCVGLAKYSRFVIGMRLHMLIYSFVAGVPSLGIAYDPKIEGVMKYFGQDTYIGILEFTKRNFLSKSQRIINGREEYINAIIHRRSELKLKNKQNIEFVTELLTKNHDNK